MDDLPDDLPDDFLAALLDEEEIVRPHRRALRVVGAIVLIGLIALLVFVPGGWLVRRTTGNGGDHKDADVTVATSTTVATLTGGPAGRTLTAADWRLQIGSAVLLGTATARCSGAVTEIDGRRYVTSARHRIDDAIEAGVVSPEPGHAQEVTGRLFDTVRVFDPVSHDRIAVLDRIAVGTGDADVLVATTKEETATYRAKPARPITSAPRPGDEVATFASSGAVRFRPQQLNGVYLGIYDFHDEDGRAFSVDLVGYRDPASLVLVGKGHSGHSPTGAGGTAFGPLLFSVNGTTSASERREDLREMGAATGLDLVAEGFRAIDESLHLAPADWARFAAVLAG